MKEKLRNAVMKIDKKNNIAQTCVYHGKEMRKRVDRVMDRVGLKQSHGICKPCFKKEMKKLRDDISKL